jgi:putative FmdB family regulatory protein
MPIYEYKCDNGHVFDVIQPISDEPLSECQECGARTERVLHPVAIHFKGSGFHNTDYGRKGAAGSNGSPASESSKESGGSKKGSASETDGVASTVPREAGTAE